MIPIINGQSIRLYTTTYRHFMLYYYNFFVSQKRNSHQKKDVKNQSNFLPLNLLNSVLKMGKQYFQIIFFLSCQYFRGIKILRIFEFCNKHNMIVVQASQDIVYRSLQILHYFSKFRVVLSMFQLTSRYNSTEDCPLS